MGRVRDKERRNRREEITSNETKIKLEKEVKVINFLTIECTEMHDI